MQWLLDGVQEPSPLASIQHSSRGSAQLRAPSGTGRGATAQLPSVCSTSHIFCPPLQVPSQDTPKRPLHRLSVSRSVSRSTAYGRHLCTSLYLTVSSIKWGYEHAYPTVCCRQVCNGVCDVLSQFLDTQSSLNIHQNS